MADIDQSKPGDELIITTHGRQFDVPQNNHAAVVYMGSNDFEANALAQVRAYVEAHGTLKNLTLVGHGNSLRIASEETPANPSEILRIPSFLDGLNKIQKDLGQKIADRIVFDACDTMTNLGPDAVKGMRNAAIKLGTQIVGATTAENYLMLNPGEVTPEFGLMVQFNSNGSVRRDDLSTSSLRITNDNKVQNEKIFNETTDENFGKGIMGFIYKHTASPGTHEFRSPTKLMQDLNSEETHVAKWFACHNGRTQEDGDACQADILPKERLESRNVKEIKTGAVASEASKEPPANGADLARKMAVVAPRI